ncbi:MAG: hypothetical protein A2V79_05475 [Betaproteobacteria bacterium RBG_16_56_24]|nr:MAG: hypothetical protein A2V79_05475 [Betaproteobacteria bacterium RBG_16_56_24]
MAMDILHFVKEKIDACSYKELETVSLDTGVPYGTLMKIKAGQTDNPRINTIQPLLKYFTDLSEKKAA